MIYVYPATIQQEKNNGYSIWFDDLPGCATSGETLAEAIMMARDAQGAWLDCAMANGDVIPVPSSPEAITLEPGQVVALVDLDLEAYRKGNDLRSVKKTLTVPAWLNTRAERAGVNFSQVLQEALVSKLGAPPQSPHATR